MFWDTAWWKRSWAVYKVSDLDEWACLNNYWLCYSLSHSWSTGDVTVGESGDRNVLQLVLAFP